MKKEKMTQEQKEALKKEKASKLDKRAEGMKRIWNFIKEEHEFENWILFALSIILLVLGLYILIAAASTADDATTSFAQTYFNIANSGWAIFDASWKVILVSSIVVAISVASIVYCLFPVFKPSFKEMKYVTWTSKKDLFTNSLIVVVFIAFLTVLFYLFDLALIPLFRLIFGD